MGNVGDEVINKKYCMHASKYGRNLGNLGNKVMSPTFLEDGEQQDNSGHKGPSINDVILGLLNRPKPPSSPHHFRGIYSDKDPKTFP